MMAVHALSMNDPRIAGADKIYDVLKAFERCIDSKILVGAPGILVAYNGKNCDLKWIWKLTQAPNSPFHMLPKLKFFLDPYKVINGYASCRLHRNHSKLESYELGVV